MNNQSGTKACGSASLHPFLRRSLKDTSRAETFTPALHVPTLLPYSGPKMAALAPVGWWKPPGEAKLAV